MDRTLTLREANQSFSRLVREVESGDTVTVTRNGRPVARIIPTAGARRVLTAEQEAALERILTRSDNEALIEGGKFDREALYEERVSRYDPR